MNLHNFRRQYQMGSLYREDLSDNPYDQFEQWFNQLLTLDVPDPTAMVVGTIGAEDAYPHQRIVLLKEFNHQGFTFFTHYDSEKAKDIDACDKVSLHFPWHFIERQVMVLGTVEKISREESASYFEYRPIESQWAAHSSPQSQPIESRESLMANYEKIQKRYPVTVPLPDNWGGYRVRPTRFEFWQGGENRLHDRFVYQLENRLEQNPSESWSITRLAP